MKGKNENKDKYSAVKTIRRMLGVVRKEDPKMFFTVAVLTFAGGIYPFFSVFLPKIAIGILEQGGEDVAARLIKSMIVYVVAASFFVIINSVFTNKTISRSMRVRMGYIAKLAHMIQTMDFKYCEDSKFWEENDRGFNSANGSSTGIEEIYKRFFKLPAALVTIIGMMIMCITLNPLVLLAVILHVVVTIWVQTQVGKYEYSYKEKQSKVSRKVSYCEKVSSDFTFGKDIRIFGFRDRLLKNYQSEIGALMGIRRIIERRRFGLGFLSLFTLLLTNGIMYGILVWKAYNGMPVSDFTMYISLISSLLALMLSFGDDLSFIANEGRYADDFFKLIDMNLISEGEKLVDRSKPIEIVLDHVTFRYPNTEVDIFKDFSFTIHGGESLAIVGVNGAGKSTLVKLICGLYAPNEGHIYINGTDINEIKKEDLFSLYSTVFQDFQIFAFTLRDNVSCDNEGGNSDKDVKIQNILRKVGLGKKLDSLDKGLDQVLLKVIDENGTDFSGGERQKLAISRALYKDAPMVIMDEPTAALDALAEQEIYEGFADLVKGKTAIYISHRLASTRFCDKIALFDKNGVREYGTHEELMAKKGEYYEMFVVQGKYYRENPNGEPENETGEVVA